MLTVGAQHDRAMGDRPRPKRPDVLLASAMTGAGVSELLASLDRRDAVRRSGGTAETDAAALKRAEAQLYGILAQRVGDQLRAPGRSERRNATLRAVAAHEIDPYSAADRLLALLAENPHE